MSDQSLPFEDFIQKMENSAPLPLEDRYCEQFSEGLQQCWEPEDSSEELARRYREFFMLSPQPMWICDNETLKFISVNQAAIEHYGYTALEFLQLKISDIRPAEDVHKFEIKFAFDDHQKPSFSGVWRHLKKDGSIIEVEVYSHRIRHKGRPARWAIINDVTDKLNAERKIKLSEERLAAAMEATGLGVYDSDLRSQVLNWDHRMRDIWGIGYDEPVDRSIFEECIHPDDRKRVMQEIKDIQVNSGTSRYKSEFRVINRRDGVERWVRAQGAVIVSDHINRNLGTVTDITDRKKSEEKIEILMREMNHRSKNLLAVIQSIAFQTAKNTNPAEFSSTFVKRLQGLSASHDLLVKCDWQAVSLADLTASQLSSFPIAANRLSISGPYIALTAQATQAIGMALHELATNSAKYGALSMNGRIEIDWDIDAEGMFKFAWTELGGPEVSPPQHKGFGTKLIQQMTAMSLQGTVTLEYSLKGVRCEIIAPLEALTTGG